MIFWFSLQVWDFIELSLCISFCFQRCFFTQNELYVEILWGTPFTNSDKVKVEKVK